MTERIQYPVSQALIDRTSNFEIAQAIAFNAIMESIQKYNALGSVSLNVPQVSAFDFYCLQPFFEQQGYTVTAVGISPVIMYIISWVYSS